MNTKKTFYPAIFLCLVTIIYTIVIANVDVAAIGPQGTSVGLAEVNGYVHELFGVNMGLYKITGILGYIAIAGAGVFALVGLVQLIQRKSLAKIDRYLIALAIIYVIVVIVYIFFEKCIVNYRPIILPGDTAPEASYPSSHTLLAFTIMGTAIPAISVALKNSSYKKILQYFCGILLILIVVGRLISGVHWLTDIVGGILFGCTLISLYCAILKAMYQKQID